MNLRTSSLFPLCGPLVVFSLAFVSCEEDVLGPLNDTVFVLESIDGAPLPASVAPEFGDLVWIVTADTIWLESGSKWRRHSVQEREPDVGGDPLDWETDGKVIRQNGQIILSFDCKDGDCLTPDRFTENGPALFMDETYLHDGRMLMFRRR